MIYGLYDNTKGRFVKGNSSSKHKCNTSKNMQLEIKPIISLIKNAERGVAMCEFIALPYRQF